MVSLCENVNANVTIRFDKPGAPLLVEPIIQVCVFSSFTSHVSFFFSCFLDQVHIHLSPLAFTNCSMKSHTENTH